MIVSVDSSIPFGWNRMIPGPERLHASAGSLLVAGAMGGAYGLIGRVVYPKAGIIPLHYAIWFAAAYQIQETFILLKNHFEDFLGVTAYLEKLEQIPEDELELDDQIRYHCWKIMSLKNQLVQMIDRIVVKYLGLRPIDDVTEDNVEDASFLEMCRYRAWRVFKATLLASVSSALAYHLTNGTGFALPNHTRVPLFIVMQSIVKDILFVPAAYMYVRACNHLVDQLGDQDVRAASLRERLFRRFLPAL